MNPENPQLLVVLPVYNEQAAIEAVVSQWFGMLDQQVDDFVMLVIDDGSEDSTMDLLERLCDDLGPRLEVRSRPNRGHGQTCVEGYREAVLRCVPYLADRFRRPV